MATHSGVEGTVKFGANTVAEITSFKVDEEARTTDDSNINDVWDTHIITTKAWTAEFECWWDETDTNGQEAGTIGASVTLNLYPEGATSGDNYMYGTATIVGKGIAVARGATITNSFKCQGNGALTKTTV